MTDKNISDIVEIERKTGVNRNTIRKLFRGVKLEAIKVSTLMKLCDYFECKMSELIEYVPDGYVPQNEE